MFKLRKIEYTSLNSRQKEAYNFHKIASRLADYGFNSVPLNDDWQGADFLAIHIDGENFLKVQLKGRLTVDAKYLGKKIYIAFLNNDACYVYPHDEFLAHVLERNKDNPTYAWRNFKSYDWPNPPKWAIEVINKYQI